MCILSGLIGNKSLPGVGLNCSVTLLQMDRDSFNFGKRDIIIAIVIKMSFVVLN